MDCSPPGSSVHGILQTRILEWVAISSSRGSSQTRDWTCISWVGRQILYQLSYQGSPLEYYSVLKRKEILVTSCNMDKTWGHNARWKKPITKGQILYDSTHVLRAKSLQSCLTLGDPIDCSPPGSSVHGILQARTLEWVAMPSSRESSWCRDQTCISCTGRWLLYHWATRNPIMYPKQSNS